MKRTLVALFTVPLLASTVPIDASAGRKTKSFVSETTVSLFEAPRPGHCTWLRLDPVQGRRDVIAEFELPCTGAGVAWSPDGTQAIVDFPGGWTDREGHRRHAWIVDLPARGTPSMEPLTIPNAGLLDLLAFDADGAPIALFLESTDRTPAVADELVFEGRAYAVPDSPGIPLLAHAYRRESGHWRRIETVATTAEACDAPGTAWLDAASADRQGPTTLRLLDPAAGHHASIEPISADLFDQLGSYERIDAEAVYAWMRLNTDRNMVLGVEASAGYAWLTTPILLVDDDGVQELDGVAENAILAAASRGRWLLLSEAVSGARPILYDLDGRILWRSTDAVSATFWP